MSYHLHLIPLNKDSRFAPFFIVCITLPTTYMTGRFGIGCLNITKSPGLKNILSSNIINFYLQFYI
nr:MAG TPA: hypothetical protein [Caudoviricetes sp.]